MKILSFVGSFCCVANHCSTNTKEGIIFAKVVLTAKVILILSSSLSPRRPLLPVRLPLLRPDDEPPSLLLHVIGEEPRFSRRPALNDRPDVLPAREGWGVELNFQRSLSITTKTAQLRKVENSNEISVPLYTTFVILIVQLNSLPASIMLSSPRI